MPEEEKCPNLEPFPQLPTAQRTSGIPDLSGSSHFFTAPHMLDMLHTTLASQKKKIRIQQHERQQLSKACGAARAENGYFFSLLWDLV